jgi:hypothetical protein
MAGCWVELEVFANVRPTASDSRDSRLRLSTHKNPNLVLPLALSVRPSVRLCVCVCRCLCVSLDSSLCEFSEVICKVYPISTSFCPSFCSSFACSRFLREHQNLMMLDNLIWLKDSLWICYCFLCTRACLCDFPSVFVTSWYFFCLPGRLRRD